MQPSIGILYNAAHDSLARALRALLPSASIVSFPADALLGRDSPRYDAFTALRQCDYVISQDTPPAFGMLSTRALAAAAQRLILLPPVEFAGFHPDTVQVDFDGTKLGGPTGPYHSRIVIAAYIAGLPPTDAADLFNPLVFSHLGYFDALRTQSTAFLNHQLAYGIDYTAALQRWIAGGCFMHATDLPKMRVVMDTARVACALMGLQPEAQPTALPPDPLAAGPTHPFFPDLAARAGMPAEGAFRAAAATGATGATTPGPVITPLAFVQASYQALSRTPLACLRVIDGVADALTRLNLDPGVRPPAKPLPGTHALLGWHGTILRLDSSNGALVHAPLWPDHPECADLALTPKTQPDGAITADILPGMDIVPGAVAGTIALRRDGKYLVADPARLAAAFRADALTGEASFLALTVAELADLRAILAQRWATEAPARLIHPAMIRLGQEYRLDFGPFTVDLAQARPAPAGAGAYALLTDLGPVTIRAMPGPPRGDGIALIPVPAAALPAEAASPGAFRSRTGQSLTLDTAQEEIVHLPLTASAADTSWLLESCQRLGLAPAGTIRPTAVLRRTPGTLLQSAGLGGMMFGAQGLLRGRLPDGAPLPTGLSHDAGVLVADPALLLQGPRLDGPVAAALNTADQATGQPPANTPGQPPVNTTDQDDADWLLGTALPLAFMAPYLPRGARLLLADPATPWRTAMLDALGLGALPRIVCTDPVCQLPDAIWLDDGVPPGLPPASLPPPGLPAASLPPPSLPAAALREIRTRMLARLPAYSGAPARVILDRRANRRLAPRPRLEKFLASRGFVPVFLDELTPDAQIRVFLHAEFIIAPAGPDLAQLAFCAERTGLLEVVPYGGFSPVTWQIARKRGLVHGVLPCAVDAADTLQIDPPALRELLKRLRLLADEP